MMPVFPTTAFRHGDLSLDAVSAETCRQVHRRCQPCTGMPAMSVPVSVEEGLPVGMQLMGPVFSEERLFRAAEKLAEVLPVETCPRAKEAK